MKIPTARSLLFLSVCALLGQLSAFAQTSQPDSNFSACKNGWASCDPSRLTDSQAGEVALAERRRNLTDCRTTWKSCDHSQLSKREATALAVAEHQRNV